MPPSEMETELPKAQVKRLVKSTLQEMIGDAPGGKEFSLSKDALLAFSEAGKVFVHFLTATATELCKENKRQTISAKDVFAALNELEFHEFAEPLRQAVESFRKVKGKGDTAKKTPVPAAKPDRTFENASHGGGGGGAGGDDDDDEEDAGYYEDEDAAPAAEGDDDDEEEEEDFEDREDFKRQRL